MTVVPLAAVLLSTASVSGQFFGSSSSRSDKFERDLEAVVEKGTALTQGRLGEVGLGFCAGAATGFACKQVQNMLVNTAIVCAGSVAAACLTGYVKVDEVMERAEAVGGAVKKAATENFAGMGRLFPGLDMDGDGKMGAQDAEVTKITLSRFAKRHAGLIAGLGGGLVVGYRIG